MPDVQPNSGGDEAAAAAAAAAAASAATGGNEKGPGEGNWRESIRDEKLRASAEKYTSLDDMVLAHNKMGGEIRDRIKLPGPNANEEDNRNFRRALKVPDTIDGYRVEVPKGIELDDADQTIIDTFKPIALKHNVPAGAFNELMNELVAKGADIKKDVSQAIDSAHNTAMAELKAEWRNDYDKNVSMATRASSSHGGQPFVDFLNNTKVEGAGLLGDHPAMVRFLAAVGRKTDEADVMLQNNSAEKSSAQDELNKILSENPIGSHKYTQPHIQARVAELHALISGNRPILGARGA